MSSESGTKFKRGLRAIFAGAIIMTGAGYFGSGLANLGVGTVVEHKLSWQGKTGTGCAFNTPNICTPQEQVEFNAYTRAQGMRGDGAADLVLAAGLISLGFAGLPKKKQQQPSV